MSAVPADRRYERYELQGIHRELCAWGKWIEEHADYDGHASQSASCSVELRGDGRPGHKILCLDMPVHVYAVHARVLRLPESEQEAVWIWYVIRIKPDGTIWPIAHRCRTVGITEEALRKRVSRARRRIAGLPVLELVKSTALAI